MIILSKSRILATIGGLLLCALAMCYADAGPAASVELKLAASVDTTFNRAYLENFKVLLEKATGERIRASILSADETRTVGEMIKKVVDGEPLLYLVPPEKLSNIDPGYGVALAPGLFKDLAHAANSFASTEFSGHFSKLGKGKGVVTLGQYVNGPVTFFLKKPVTTDLKGLKMRVVGSAMERTIVSALRGTSIANYFEATTPPDDRSVVDGARWGMGAALMKKWYEGTPISIVSNFAYSSTMSILSETWFKELDAETKNAVLKAAEEMNAWAAKMTVERYNLVKNAWVDAGGKIFFLPKEAENNLKKNADFWVATAYKDRTVLDLYEQLKRVCPRN